MKFHWVQGVLVTVIWSDPYCLILWGCHYIQYKVRKLRSRPSRVEEINGFLSTMSQMSRWPLLCTHSVLTGDIVMATNILSTEMSSHPCNISMRCAPLRWFKWRMFPRLRHLGTWSPLSGIVRGGCGTLERWSLARRSIWHGEGFQSVYGFYLISISSPHFVLMVEMALSATCSCHHVCCLLPWLPPWWILIPLELYAQVNPSF